MEVKREEHFYSCENKSDLGSGHTQSLTELSGGPGERCSVADLAMGSQPYDDNELGQERPHTCNK